MKYYTPDGTNVTKRIEDKKTEVFESHTAAVEFADQQNSYVYDLHAQAKDEKRPTFYGYAVPK